MSSAGPFPGDEPARQAARWCALLAEVLGDVGRRAARLGELVGRDWPDVSGREWAERAARLGVALGREADVAAELSGSYRREAGEAPGPAAPPLPGALAGRRTGMRIGGTAAGRVEDERGMRIAELGPPAPG